MSASTNKLSQHFAEYVYRLWPILWALQDLVHKIGGQLETHIIDCQNFWIRQAHHRRPLLPCRHSPVNSRVEFLYLCIFRRVSEIGYPLIMLHYFFLNTHFWYTLMQCSIIMSTVMIKIFCVYKRS